MEVCLYLFMRDPYMLYPGDYTLCAFEPDATLLTPNPNHAE